MKIVATIPARYGSKRIKTKNLRLLDGKPLIQYAITAAKQSQKIDEIYVNTENDIIGQIAVDNHVNYYKRDPSLAEDDSTSDQFNYDFMTHVPADIIVMVNPVAPLVRGEDIDAMIQYYLDHDLDTLIPVREEKLHAFCGSSPYTINPDSSFQSYCSSNPLNFDINAQLPRTQDIEPVKICSWTLCIWKPSVFMKAYEKKGRAVFSGKVGLYPLAPLKSIKISEEQDFILAELLLQNEHKWRYEPVQYDSQKISSDYPAMWLSEIRYIEKCLLHQSQTRQPFHVLEWGSGNSTVYFSGFLKKHQINFTWSAIENYIPWHTKVTEMILDKQLEAYTTCYLKSPTCEERKRIQETMDLSEFLHFPFDLNRKFDLILIDARKRTECMKLAPSLLSDTGVVILHDAERDDCLPLMTIYEDGGSFVCENKSPVPGGVQKLWIGNLSKN